jgi:hypothetical protein
MAEAGEDLIARAEILIDRLGLGRGFYNENVHQIRNSEWSVTGGYVGRGDTGGRGRTVSTRDLGV